MNFPPSELGGALLLLLCLLLPIMPFATFILACMVASGAIGPGR